VRVAFALDCCDREAMAWVATTQGIKGEDVRDLMVASVESRFGQVNRLPRTIEWLSDNGSGYIAKETRAFARDLGFKPLTTPVTSPQSNGMAEAFVRTIKRDYARVNQTPDARTVIENLPLWFGHYNAVHPHSALRYRSPREFIAAQSNREAVSGLQGATTHLPQILRQATDQHLARIFARRSRCNSNCSMLGSARRESPRQNTFWKPPRIHRPSVALRPSAPLRRRSFKLGGSVPQPKC